MRIESKQINNTLYVGLSGELDEHASEYARTRLDLLLAAQAISRVIIDLSELIFMDSTGIGVLIGRYKKLKGKEIPIYIANPSIQADKIFKMTGLYEIMPKIC
jgi:stage II sporulation protein AA (anti-sigma F factor antagonist)